VNNSQNLGHTNPLTSELRQLIYSNLTCRGVSERISSRREKLLDFKLSPCFICSAFSFGYLPGVWVLKADVSEHSIGSTHPQPVTHLAIGSARACLNPVRYKYPTQPNPSYFIDLPMKMERIECSETSAFSTQTPGRYPKEKALREKLISTVIFSDIFIIV